MKITNKQIIFFITILLLLLPFCDKNRPAKRCSALKLTGTIEKILPSKESIMYAIAFILISNPNPQPVSIIKYRIIWKGGSFTGYGLNDKIIAAGKTRRFSIRITYANGDINILLKDQAAAQVKIIDCR